MLIGSDVPMKPLNAIATAAVVGMVFVCICMSQRRLVIIPDGKNICPKQTNKQKLSPMGKCP